jgi:hypothetical protein
MRQHVPTSGIRLGIARGVSYGLFGPPEQIVAPTRELGGGLIRAFVYWNQIEPEPGRFEWTIVDALIAQLTGEEELWITVCSSSRWGTRVASDFLPSSPANDDGAYYRFLRELVSRCAGRVAYWQCNNEPSNVDLLWAGSPDDYVAQLRTFDRAVRDADPLAAVVLGGCGYDVLSCPVDGPAHQFFDRVLAEGAECFDLFDIHLYDEPRLIGAHIAAARSMMRAHGYERPIMVGEYNGPTLFQLPELQDVLQRTMAEAFAGDTGGGRSTDELTATAALDTPERRAMKTLYAALPTLPAALQMFMVGCAPALDDLRDRINCREIVSRNMFALSEGVTRTVCWQLAPEVGNFEDPFTMMELMHGKLPLLAYEDGKLGRRRPAADTFRLLTRLLDDAESVTRLECDDEPGLCAFVVERPHHGSMLVVWKDADLICGEQAAPTFVECDWPHDSLVVTDAFGTARPAELEGSRARLAVSVTPTFLTPQRPSRRPVRSRVGAPASARVQPAESTTAARRQSHLTMKGAR